MKKAKAKQTLKTGVWVNIRDFLDAVRDQKPVHLFPSQRALAAYTRDTKRIYPKRRIKKDSPLRQLLAPIF